MAGSRTNGPSVPGRDRRLDAQSSGELGAAAMNCQEFRRKTQIDPLARDVDLLAHEEACPDCSAFARTARAAEIRLRTLLREVTAPDERAEGIYDRAQTENRRRRWHAIAFGLLLLIFMSMLIVNRPVLDQGRTGLARAVLEHIGSEAHHLDAQGQVPDSQLHRLFHRFGAQLTEGLGDVLFAGECRMRTHTGIHLVLPGRAGPVTVLFMPGETTDGAMPVAPTEFNGVIVPTNWGSIAVVGNQGEDIADVRDRMVRAVRWPSSG
jgi:hypothetical protein